MSTTGKQKWANPNSYPFNEQAKRVLSLAQEEAKHFRCSSIGTEHLLLGLVREHDGIAANVLRTLGVDLVRARSSVEILSGHGESAAVGELSLTPRAKEVMDAAVDEALRLHHGYVGTEHLLLGLVHEEEGIAQSVLGSLGVSLEMVRAKTLQAIDLQP
ncbi:MAG: hypothetical protein JOZ18_09540 [Chloroflexi bacterium]|nr:hypothetical protein [Chloroflexota bacterium]